MEKKRPIFEKKNVLVTGGAGFIGSHLCDELIKKNKVICLDNLEGGRVENINHLLTNPDFEFIKNDVNEPFALEKYRELDKFKVKFQGVQEIYHLACPTSPKNFESLRIQTLKTNSIGTINVLEVAKKYQAKFLLASSAVVYGPRHPKNPYFPEDYHGFVNFTGPRSCYDEGKRFAETAAVTYRLMYKVETKIARIFRTYGPRMSLFEGQMVADFVLQSFNNDPLIIYGDESFTSSFCYVSDLVDGLVKMMASSLSGPLNLGHYEEHKISELAEKIVKMTNSKSKIIYQDPLLFMTPLGLPNITQANNKLGWYPLVSLDNGLKRTIDYVEANRLVLQPLYNKDKNNNQEKNL